MDLVIVRVVVIVFMRFGSFHFPGVQYFGNRSLQMFLGGMLFGDRLLGDMFLNHFRGFSRLEILLVFRKRLTRQWRESSGTWRRMEISGGREGFQGFPNWRRRSFMDRLGRLWFRYRGFHR